MKLLLTGILLVGVSGAAIADCKPRVSHGQHKQACDNSNDNSLVEYGEISSAGIFRSNTTTKPQKLDRSETHVRMAQSKTTLTPEQVKQLVEYANSQGCNWEGIQHRPLLTCPK